MTNHDMPIEELLPRAGNSVYRLVRMASNRAVQLAEGKPRLIKHPFSDKETTQALQEIAEGKVMLKEVADLKHSAAVKPNGKTKQENKE